MILVTNTNWSGNIEFADTKTLHPTDIKELQREVTANIKIRARGSAHCFNHIADTDAVAIILDRMPADVVIDAAKKTVTVGAGMKYGEVASFLHEQGWALHNLASLPHISIAGAIATGTHGSGVNSGGLQSAVRSLEIVMADGSLRTINQSHGDLLNAVVVGLGLFGIVSRIELAIEPTFNIGQTIYQSLPRATYAQNFFSIMSTAYSVSYFTTWGPDGIGDVWAKYKEGADIAPDLFGALPAHKKLHPIPGIDARHCTEQLGALGPWHQRLPHFKMESTPSVGDELQSEFFISIEDAPAAFAAIERLSSQINPLLLVSEIRAVAADTHWMAGTYERHVAAFHFTWKKIGAVYDFLPQLEEVLAEFSYRPHLGKVFSAKTSYLQTVFPKFDDFSALTQEFDPTRKFHNQFTQQLLGLT